MEICNNCKFFKKDVNEEPCFDCINGLGEKVLLWEPAEAKEIKLEKRPEMLPMPLPIYERTESEIPEKVRISFTNGTSAIYELHVDQPAPIIVENIRIIRKWNTGYQAPKRRERR